MHNGNRQETIPRSPSIYSPPQSSYRSHIVSSPVMSRNHRSPQLEHIQTTYAPPPRERPPGTFFDTTKEDRGGGATVTSPTARLRSPIMVCEKSAIFKAISDHFFNRIATVQSAGRLKEATHRQQTQHHGLHLRTPNHRVKESYLIRTHIFTPRFQDMPLIKLWHHHLALLLLHGIGSHRPL